MTKLTASRFRRVTIARRLLMAAGAGVVLSASIAAQNGAPRTFNTPEDAVQTLIRIVKGGNLDELLTLFGSSGQELVAGSDPATGRANRQVFTVAAAEGWRLVDQGPNRKVLIVGNEGWPFPVPLLKQGQAWHFDAAAGKEEVIARRIGRNELAVIESCRAYVAAQRHYAQQGHDGKPSGVYATRFRSDPGKQNGLYWPVARGQKRSPLGDLIAEAAEVERPVAGERPQQSTFHGYYFKILTAQGPAASGGAKNWVVNGELKGGFALVAWPAQYNVSGVMTFIISHDGVLFEKDLGTGTDGVAKAMTSYNPGASWRRVVPQTN